MLRSKVSLEMRILLHAGRRAFCLCPPGPSGTTCPVCRGKADAIPLPEPGATRSAWLLAGALSCALEASPRFERSASTPSPPEPSRISGLSLLAGTGGALPISFHRRTKRVGVRELRVEEDAGRLLHAAGGARMDYSTLGLPSIRIITDADLEMGEEAERFLQELWERIDYLGIAGRGAREAVVRCNAYASLAPDGDPSRAFVKLRNLNSFNFARKAINYELARQERVLESGGRYEAESRIWNEAKNATEFYQKRWEPSSPRYKIVKGLAPFDASNLVAIASDTRVPLPEERATRFMREHGLNSHQAVWLGAQKERASFFEATVAEGADPQLAAHWMLSHLSKIARHLGVTVDATSISPSDFASVLKLLGGKRVPAPLARQALWNAAIEGVSAEKELEAIAKGGVPDQEALGAIADRVVAEHQRQIERIRSGDAKTMRHLIGRVIELSGGFADASLARELLAERIKVSYVLVAAMGGGITGARGDDGRVAPGGERALKELVESLELPEGLRCSTAYIRGILSEEIGPDDWAALITFLSERIREGEADGIVVTHGMDTLAYTASLIHWLFGSSGVPIIFVSSSKPASESPEARAALTMAIKAAQEQGSGVRVCVGGKLFPACNLRFERPAPDGFRTWNADFVEAARPALFQEEPEADDYVLRELLRDAADKICVLRVYPGMRADYLMALVNAGARFFILELFDSGTANLRDGPYSLKEALAYGARRGVKFFCTSQQEGLVDFSGYESSRSLWARGAVPMGGLCTESVYGLYMAASLMAESEEEVASIMEGMAEA